MLSCPFRQEVKRGVVPSVLTWSMLAPLSISSDTTAACPIKQATNRGVNPFASASLWSAPASSRSFAVFASPALAAVYRAVSFFSPRTVFRDSCRWSLVLLEELDEHAHHLEHLLLRAHHREPCESRTSPVLLVGTVETVSDVVDGGGRRPPSSTGGRGGQKRLQILDFARLHAGNDGRPDYVGGH